MSGLRKRIAEALLLRLENHPGKRVLLCGSDIMLYNMARKKLPSMAIECLHRSEVENFVSQIDVPVAESYDYILDMGLIEESNWNDQLIRAMGFHLYKSECQLRIAFPAMGNMPDHFTAVNKGFANWFSPYACVGISNMGELFSEGNWGSKHMAASWYMVAFKDFDSNTAWLQSFYTPELRWEICARLSRIEYDISPYENASDVLALVKQYHVDKTYFYRLLKSVAINEAKVRAVLEKTGMDFD